MRLCKIQISTQTNNQIPNISEKNVSTNKNCILRKKSLKFQNPSFNILCKVPFWNKQKCGAGCPGKKAACLMGQP